PLFLFVGPSTTVIFSLSLHDALPISAIIFLLGSGGYSSHSRDYKTFLDFFLESPLNDQDVSFLYFDKRGVAPSEGKWFKTTFEEDRKSTRLNSSHVKISYAVFCLKKK